MKCITQWCNEVLKKKQYSEVFNSGVMKCLTQWCNEVLKKKQYSEVFKTQAV